MLYSHLYLTSAPYPKRTHTYDGNIARSVGPVVSIFGGTISTSSLLLFVMDGDEDTEEDVDTDGPADTEDDEVVGGCLNVCCY